MGILIFYNVYSYPPKEGFHVTIEPIVRGNHLKKLVTNMISSWRISIPLYLHRLLIYTCLR